ncbi:MAG: response regulator, partial [Archangium sp.]|nr:response regulator [Archangium sp.]
MVIVDDDEAICFFTERALSSRARVVVAESAAMARDLIVQQRGIVSVLTDYGMPAENGSALLDWVKVARPGVRRVMMSAQDVLGFIRPGLCDAVLTTPFTVRALELGVFGPTFIAAGRNWKLVLEAGLLRIEWSGLPDSRDLELELEAESRVLAFGSRHCRLVDLGPLTPEIAPLLPAVVQW